ncbi:hypothetical protein OB919_14555 [Halobacteria archaeon AArc-curdl1]|uniref:Uncharacterized protein n=1 Tax=Natronosalvus hydrolyticus TaxID=2979988 RepID=A0AAP2ZA33_9EURY|nr:hypothetical protein [Halobacteria archaeon AArc-curdl1]
MTRASNTRTPEQKRTDTASSDGATEPNRDTLGTISHSNPLTGETAGHLFNRGPIVVADGGKANAVEKSTTADDGTDAETMEEVSHTPPRDADDANGVFERGGTERIDETK